MSAYWVDTLRAMIPGLLLASFSALPVGLGTLAATRHLRKGARVLYIRNLWGSIAAGAVTLLLLFGSLFGDDLASSSTAGLIFLFAPIYAAMAQGLFYGFSTLVVRRTDGPPNEAISPESRRLLVIPTAMLLVVLVGIVKSSLASNDLAMAERASSPETLALLYDKSVRGEVDSFGVSLFLAQNPNTPEKPLRKLALHPHPAVRAQVAQHPHTPLEIVSSLSNDCAGFVRELVEKRLGSQRSNKALQPTHPPSGECAAER